MATPLSANWPISKRFLKAPRAFHIKAVRGVIYGDWRGLCSALPAFGLVLYGVLPQL